MITQSMLLFKLFVPYVALFEGENSSMMIIRILTFQTFLIHLEYKFKLEKKIVSGSKQLNNVE